jgi:antitoxin HicB
METGLALCTPWLAADPHFTLKVTGMETTYKLPLVLDPQPEGGYTVTCPLIPELVTEGDTVREALQNASDALAALIEAYEDLDRPLPPGLQQSAPDAPIWLETAVVVG